MSNASNAARELTCDDGLTNDEISSLAATKSEAEWNAACNAIKKARGGMYPRDWWPLVQMSGFMARQVASWKEAK